MIRINELVKSYQGSNGRVPAVRGISLDVKAGSFVSLLGPSGCGKTSTLRCIAGLEEPDSGEINVDDRVFFSSASSVSVPPNRRDLGMVFQSYAIWPHMTVFENAAFPLRVGRRRVKEAVIKDRVMAVLEKLSLSTYAQRNATQLSGGQQQRLALARALVIEPRVLLLDEPLSNLDARLRDQMRSELKQLQSSLGVTTIYVTHDQTEALAMSSTVVVMNQGAIVQQGAPLDIYANPRDRFVADFIGSANFIQGTWQALEGDRGIVSADCGQLSGRSLQTIPDGTQVALSIRPEDVRIIPDPNATGIAGTVKSVTFLGEQSEIEIDLGTALITARQHYDMAIAEGERVRVELAPGKCVAIPSA